MTALRWIGGGAARQLPTFGSDATAGDHPASPPGPGTTLPIRRDQRGSTTRDCGTVLGANVCGADWRDLRTPVNMVIRVDLVRSFANEFQFRRDPWAHVRTALDNESAQQVRRAELLALIELVNDRGERGPGSDVRSTT